MYIEGIRGYLLYILRLVFVIFVADIAHYALQQIFHRDDAQRAAVLVEHYCYLLVIFIEVGKKLAALARFGHKFYLVHIVGSGGVFVRWVKYQRQQVFDVKHAANIVYRFVKDRYARNACFHRNAHSLRHGRCFLHSAYLAAVGHHLADLQIGKLEYVRDHLCLIVLYAALFVGGVEHLQYLLARHLLGKVFFFHAEYRRKQRGNARYYKLRGLHERHQHAV